MCHAALKMFGGHSFGNCGGGECCDACLFKPARCLKCPYGVCKWDLPREMTPQMIHNLNMRNEAEAREEKAEAEKKAARKAREEATTSCVNTGYTG